MTETALFMLGFFIGVLVAAFGVLVATVYSEVNKWKGKVDRHLEKGG